MIAGVRSQIMMVALRLAGPPYSGVAAHHRAVQGRCPGGPHPPGVNRRVHQNWCHPPPSVRCQISARARSKNRAKMKRHSGAGNTAHFGQEIVPRASCEADRRWPLALAAASP